MEQITFRIVSNIRLTDSMWQLVLAGDASAFTRPGQFANIQLPGFFLRRPISVCDWTADSLTLLYKQVGQGTEYMTTLADGKTLDILTGLGNGFDTAKSGEQPLLIGGGAGVPPMYALAKALLAEGKQPQVILGFNTAAEIFYEAEFRKLCPTYVATADGSAGKKGFVTDVMKDLSYTYFYTCGPMPMFRAIEELARTSGQYSFEERMGCGFGACMGCTCHTKDGHKRICKDGPVLEREEILWQTLR